MNKQILNTLERQLTEVSGMLVIAGVDNTDTNATRYWLEQIHARVSGLVQGLRLLDQTLPEELEQAQFDRAIEVDTPQSEERL